MTCSMKLRALHKPCPRTCEDCKLGPCKLVCLRETYQGQTNSIPGLCEICGVGPCVKTPEPPPKPVEPDPAVSSDPDPALTKWMDQVEFDQTIGRLDRLLSELIILAKGTIDVPNQQTLKHHAEDMVGAGQKILSLLNDKENLQKGWVWNTSGWPFQPIQVHEHEWTQAEIDEFKKAMKQGNPQGLQPWPNVQTIQPSLGWGNQWFSELYPKGKQMDEPKPDESNQVKADPLKETEALINNPQVAPDMVPEPGPRVEMTSEDDVKKDQGIPVNDQSR